jgi:hypothetical protein
VLGWALVGCWSGGICASLMGGWPDTDGGLWRGFGRLAVDVRLLRLAGGKRRARQQRGVRRFGPAEIADTGVYGWRRRWFPLLGAIHYDQDCFTASTGDRMWRYS